MAEKVELGDKGKAGEDVGAKEEMVSKAEFEKIKSSHEDLTKNYDRAKKELDNAKLEILNPDYIQWMEDKKRGSKAKAPVDDTDLETMPRKQFMEMVTETIVSEIRGELGNVKATVNDVVARLEVKECEGKYKDFWDFKEDMVSLVKENDKLKIEDAYKLAKQNRKMEKEEKEKEEAAKATKEKPGGPASGSTSPKSFKGEKDASEDAWSKVVGDKDTF